MRVLSPHIPCTAGVGQTITHTVCMGQAMSVDYQRGSVQPEVPAQPWCRLRVCGWNLPQRQACDAYLGSLATAQRPDGGTRRCQAPWSHTGPVVEKHESHSGGHSGPSHAHTPFLQWTAKSVPLLGADTSRPARGRPNSAMSSPPSGVLRHRSCARISRLRDPSPGFSWKESRMNVRSG